MCNNNSNDSKNYMQVWSRLFHIVSILWLGFITSSSKKKSGRLNIKNQNMIFTTNYYFDRKWLLKKY